MLPLRGGSDPMDFSPTGDFILLGPAGGKRAIVMP